MALALLACGLLVVAACDDVYVLGSLPIPTDRADAAIQDASPDMGGDGKAPENKF